jgi:hypothetical protein
MESVTYSALALGRSSEKRKVVPRNVSLEEYYLRWGFLPPGFLIEKNGKVIHGGGPEWEKHSAEMGYPREPSPRSTFGEVRQYQQWLDSRFRPWLRGDPEIFQKLEDGRSNDLREGDWDPVAYEARKRDLEARPIPPEQMASANEWLRKAGVESLPKDDQRRRDALAEWGKWYRKQGLRKPEVKGWA